MNEVLLATVAVLVTLGLLAAVILYFVSKKFYVKEDPRLIAIQDALPATNCGGCGYPGCNAFAEALLKADDLEKLHCPVGGNAVMKEVADILGMEVKEREPYIAVVKCAGHIGARKYLNEYDGVKSCELSASLYSGERGCADGCVGLGDCVEACDFDAMFMDENTGLPYVVEDKCTACNACVTTCPKDIIELWPKGKKSKRIYIACVNEEKGGTARKECSMACTGCGKCEEECTFDAISIVNNLAQIDYDKCKLCGKCVVACDVGSIIADNFSEKQLEKLAQKREERLEKQKQIRLEERKRAKEAAKKAKEEQALKPS